MDFQFQGGELNMDERSLAEVTNAKLIEMYQQVRAEMGDAGRDITFTPDPDPTNGFHVGGPSEAVVMDFMERAKKLTAQ